MKEITKTYTSSETSEDIVVDEIEVCEDVKSEQMKSTSVDSNEFLKEPIPKDDLKESFGKTNTADAVESYEDISSEVKESETVQVTESPDMTTEANSNKQSGQEIILRIVDDRLNRIN